MRLEFHVVKSFTVCWLAGLMRLISDCRKYFAVTLWFSIVNLTDGINKFINRYSWQMMIYTVHKFCVVIENSLSTRRIQCIPMKFKNIDDDDRDGQVRPALCGWCISNCANDIICIYWLVSLMLLLILLLAQAHYALFVTFVCVCNDIFFVLFRFQLINFNNCNTILLYFETSDLWIYTWYWCAHIQRMRLW